MKKISSIISMVILAVCMSVIVHAKTVEIEGSINVNEATVEQLQMLPGVGPSKAQMIVDARSLKPFSAQEDLLSVKGVGEKTLAKWSPYLSFSGKTTLQEKNQ